MIWRIALLGVVIGAAWFGVALWERRTAFAGFRPVAGLTLVTGADCSMCPQAVAAVDGVAIPVSIIDVADAGDPTIRSIPTALVADAGGRVIARRSGRSVITAMPQLIALARSVT